MTELEICNWALLKLGQRPLTSLDGEQDIKASYCRLLLPPLHRSLLRSFAWNFAIQTTRLSPLVSDKQGGGRYSLPKKCLKVLKMEEEGELRGDCIVVQGKTSGVLSITYIEDVSISDCDPLYQEAVACKLASELCPILISDDQLRAYLKGESDKVVAIATDTDGIEMPEKRVY